MNLDLLIRKIVILAFSVAGAVGSSFAQEEDVSTLTDNTAVLDVTTVTGDTRSAIIRHEAAQQAAVPSVATKTTRPVADEIDHDAPFLLPSVDTISGAEIRTYQRRDVADILRRTAGTSIVRTGQAGSQTSLFIRGMESNHTVVLLNGRRLPPGLAGLYQLEYLDASNLESVQILRGSASSLYGSDAIAGVVDLRSTDARFVESNTLSSYTEGGSFSTFRTGQKATLRDGPVGVVIDTNYHDTHNDRPFSDFNNGTVRGNAAVDLGDGVHFDVLGYVQDSELQVPGSSLAFGFPQMQVNENRSALVSPRFSIERDDWDFSVFYSYTTNDLRATDDPFLNDNLLEQTGHETEAVFNYRPTDDAVLTLGGGHYDYSFTRTPLIPGPFNPDSSFGYAYSGVFAQAELDLPANFHLLTSGRYDDHDSFESKGTYTVQLAHEIETTGTTIFGKVGTGYKAPSGQDFVFLAPTLDPFTLMPEESESREIGVRQNLFSARNSLSVTYFEADLENLIDVDPFTFVDPAVVDTETSGFEVELRTAPCDSAEFYANYTYLDANVVDGVYFTVYNPGERLVRRPRHTLSAGLVVRGDKWTAGAELVGAYDRADSKDFLTGETLFVDDYTAARLFGSVDVRENIEVYARLENVFDEQYEQTAGFESAGFGAFAGVRILLGH
ncbi:MAG: TonB-dependent receptor plug domain-containing protein [Verrucomicrobiales bacterium]